MAASTVPSFETRTEPLPVTLMSSRDGSAPVTPMLPSVPTDSFLARIAPTSPAAAVRQSAFALKISLVLSVGVTVVAS